MRPFRAISLVTSTISCSMGLRPSIFMAANKSFTEFETMDNNPTLSHLGVNGSLPEAGLEAPEDGGDGLHLGGGEDVRGPGGGGGAGPWPAVSYNSSAHI